MPASFVVEGRAPLLLALNVDAWHSLPAVRRGVCHAYADIAGEELLPATLVVEFEDEGGDGLCRLESNGPIVDGRLRCARSLRVAARAADKGPARGRR